MKPHLEFAKISKITKTKLKTKVYNFNVSGYENYIANGIVIHNCQNFMVSQRDRSKDAKRISPEKLISIAKSKECKIICFTYNEPIIYFEYVIDVANLCKDNDIYLVLKTNAYAESKPWSVLCNASSAMNIDWKGTQQRYRKVAKANSGPVLERIREAIDLGIHIEISVPVYHDSDINEYEEFRSFLFNLDKNIPVHLLKLFPANRTNIVSMTSDFLMKKVYDFMSESLNYVYIANMFGEENKKYRNTQCKNCGVNLIDRFALQSKILVYKRCCESCPVHMNI